MSHTIELPDEVYRAIVRYAARHGQTPEAVIRAWADALPTEPGDDLDSYVYNPADDPLVEFLGTIELTDPDAIRHHDAVIAAEALDAHRD